MKGKSVDLLKTAITTISGWRSTAVAANIQLQQVIIVLPDNTKVVMVWNDQDLDWDITT